MKKRNYLFTLLLCLSLFYSHPAKAQFIVGDLIRLTITKVIKAIDLQVQRMQNKTIWLQNAQKVLENNMAKLRLTDIAGWAGKQKELYAGYYEELQKVKSTLAYYQKIREVITRQARLVGEYRQARLYFRQANAFTAAEAAQMQKVYDGILKESLASLDQLLLVTSHFKTQMTDAQRLAMIDQAADRMQENYNDLHAYNQENLQLSIQRTRENHNLQSIQQLYEIK